MPRVFVVQEPLKKTPNGVMPRIDYSTLKPYGEMVIIFRWGELKDEEVMHDTTPLLEKLRDALQDFGDDDCLVCLGNPALCAMALAVALEQNGGYACVLDWIRDDRRYRLIEIDMHPQAA